MIKMFLNVSLPNNYDVIFSDSGKQKELINEKEHRHTRIFSSNTSINKVFSFCKILDSVLCVKEALTQDTYKDLYCCMHFVDDWEADYDEEWQEFFQATKILGRKDSVAVLHTVLPLYR